MTAEEARIHPWLLVDDRSLEAHDLRNNLEQLKLFHAKKKLRAELKKARRTTFPAHRPFRANPLTPFSSPPLPLSSRRRIHSI